MTEMLFVDFSRMPEGALATAAPSGTVTSPVTPPGAWAAAWPPNLAGFGTGPMAH
jgi:hypothetical protein